MNPDRILPLYIDDASLVRAYPVETVARIAASLPDSSLTSAEKIEVALDLLRAAESRALPGPWDNQHQQHDEELGDAVDLDEVERQWQREQELPRLIASSTRDGHVVRNLLAHEAYCWTGTGESKDQAKLLYLEWAKETALRHHAWASMVASGARHDDGKIDYPVYAEWFQSYNPPKAVDRDEFLTKFEVKVGREVVFRDEASARSVLLGCAAFDGLLKWLDHRLKRESAGAIRSRKPDTKGQYTSKKTRGSGRAEDGTFESRDA